MTDQTPADELRAAAQRIRDLAERAIHEDRPHWSTGNTLGSRSPVVIDDPEQPSVLIETYAARLEAVNRYIAAMDPALGRAVADLLEARLWIAENDPGSFGTATDTAALALARAITQPIEESR